jgi:hypothetical protein
MGMPSAVTSLILTIMTGQRWQAFGDTARGWDRAGG